MSDEFRQEYALQTVLEVVAHIVLIEITPIGHELYQLGAHEGQDIFKLYMNQSLDHVFWKHRLAGLRTAIRILGRNLHLV